MGDRFDFVRFMGVKNVKSIREGVGYNSYR